MKNRERLLQGYEGQNLLVKAQRTAKRNIGLAIPRLKGCEVTFKRQPTHAWRVGIYKKGVRLTKAEFYVVEEITHKALAPLRCLLYGDATAEQESSQ